MMREHEHVPVAKIEDSSRVYFAKGDRDYFTPREAQSLYCLVYDKKRQKVADRLGLSRRTVDVYLEMAKRKTGTISQKDLLDYAQKTNFAGKMRKHYRALVEPGVVLK